MLLVGGAVVASAIYGTTVLRARLSWMLRSVRAKEHSTVRGSAEQLLLALFLLLVAISPEEDCRHTVLPLEEIVRGFAVL